MTPTTRLPLVAITADDIRSLYTHESSIYSTAWELKDDLEEAAALIEKQGAQIEALQADKRSLQDKLIRWQVWDEFYGRLKSVKHNATDNERVLKQAEIISDMQRRIRHQRSEIRRLIPIDRMQKGRNLPGYNVYRHCNKLYNMWWTLRQEHDALAAKTLGERE